MGYSYRHCSAPEDVIFTQALFQGRPGDPADDPRRDGPHHRGARSLAADQGKDRRLDLQESRRSQGLAIDRRRRLSRPDRRRRAGERDALQFPHQSRQRPPRPTSRRSARRARARARRRAASSCTGKSNGSECPEMSSIASRGALRSTESRASWRPFSPAPGSTLCAVSASRSPSRLAGHHRLRRFMVHHFRREISRRRRSLCRRHRPESAGRLPRRCVPAVPLARALHIPVEPVVGALVFIFGTSVDRDFAR